VALTVLSAGCSAPEREQVEGEVRAIIGARAAEGTWRVSLVKMGSRWSVTLDGPSQSALSFVAEAGRLREAFATALGGGAAVAVSGARGEVPARVSRDRHRCVSCGRSFDLIYETVPDEPQEIVSVACPHCWAKSAVLVGESAAYTQAFLAEKVEP
jgi:DNA-directed RNA polymerase subunit RPC12/RpoP